MGWGVGGGGGGDSESGRIRLKVDEKLSFTAHDQWAEVNMKTED